MCTQDVLAYESMGVAFYSSFLFPPHELSQCAGYIFQFDLYPETEKGS